MWENEVDQAELIRNALRSLETAMGNAAGKFGELTSTLYLPNEENEHFRRNVQLHRMDQSRGDYQHRCYGKRPIPGRFRYLDEASEMTQADWDYVRRWARDREPRQ